MQKEELESFDYVTIKYLKEQGIYFIWWWFYHSRNTPI